MENVFEELIGNADANDSVDTTASVQNNDAGDDFDHTYDLDINNLSDEDDSDEDILPVNVADNNQDATPNVSNEGNNPTNAAFAQMRTQNKELQNALNEINALAQSAGLKDYNELIAKSKEAQLKRQAQSQGIPLEVARELEDFRAFKAQYQQDKEQAIVQQKERTFVSNVNEFVQSNGLTGSSIDKLSQDLEKDGLSVETLMDLPKSALNRILNSYVGADYQKNLERKSAIKKELPINQSSKIDSNVLNKEIDTLAKQLAGKF